MRASGDDFTLVEVVRDIPTYAILSHTWGADEDEVTFKDISKGKGKGKKKPGYAKLQFCAAQAAKVGITYFWVDTCCIDKSSSAELTEAINSMFKWYRNSAICYVYLSDVFSCINATPGSNQQPIITNSRWFERGWTLQELLAPQHVVFFSRDGTRLGDKSSLAKEIALSTSIPRAVIENGPGLMFKCTTEERMNWAMFRRTKREEDAAYCLFGIFEVQMPLIYGEGKANAYSRLKKEVEVLYGRRDWIDDLLHRYRLPSLHVSANANSYCLLKAQLYVQIPWVYKTRAITATVKSIILLCAIYINTFMVLCGLPLRIGFLCWTVAATPLYLHGCTRWNRAEGFFIFLLVVGISYTAGTLIGLQREVKRLSDIVFDNVMMQGIDQETMHTQKIVRHIRKAAT